ncbi:MAG: GNAT family N-acetyltransferase [Pirellula sp.]|nr:GNAT family N-acetyltransferase [Pirellula sp.]
MHNIRDARPSDAPTIVDFNIRMAWETEQKRLDPTKITPGVAAVLSRPELGRYFVAENVTERESEVIGQLMITYEWSDWRNGNFWWIQSVYVREDTRGQGVFRALYEHVERLARADAGSCGLRLYVEHANERAKGVYRKLGMQPSDYVFYEIDWSA